MLAAGGFVLYQWITGGSERTISGSITTEGELRPGGAAVPCGPPDRMILEDGSGAFVDSAATRETEYVCTYSFVFRDVPDLPRYVFSVEGERGEWRYSRHAVERDDWKVDLAA